MLTMQQEQNKSQVGPSDIIKPVTPSRVISNKPNFELSIAEMGVQFLWDFEINLEFGLSTFQ